jgi:hypothetical protein
VILQLLFVRAQSPSPGCLCWAQDVQGISNCRLIILSWKGNCKVSHCQAWEKYIPKGQGLQNDGMPEIGSICRPRKSGAEI